MDWGLPLFAWNFACACSWTWTSNCRQSLAGLRLGAEPRYRDTYHFHGLERLDAAW